MSSNCVDCADFNESKYRERRKPLNYFRDENKCEMQGRKM